MTAILPGPAEGLFREPVPAGAAVLNGAGEMTGCMAVAEWGLIETPVYLTSTMAVGRILDGAVAAAVAADPAVGTEDVVIPVVAECDDSWLSDSAVVQVEARGRRPRAGAGARRRGRRGRGRRRHGHGLLRLEGRHRHVQPARAGDRRDRRRARARQLRRRAGPARSTACPPAARCPIRKRARAQPAGSCIAVVATDAPLAPAQLTRLARRAGLGLGRTGSVAHHGSGEIFLAFATSGRRPRAEVGRRSAEQSLPDSELDPLFAATVDATEEAVLNALWAAPTSPAARAPVRGCRTSRCSSCCARAAGCARRDGRRGAGRTSRLRGRVRCRGGL